MSDEKNTFLGTVFTFLTGAAIGAGLALLFAPQSGEDTRKKLKEASDKLSEEAKENYEKVMKETQQAIDSVKKTSERAIEQVKAFVDGAKEGIKKDMAKAGEEKTEKPKAAAAKKA